MPRWWSVHQLLVNGAWPYDVVLGREASRACRRVPPRALPHPPATAVETLVDTPVAGRAALGTAVTPAPLVQRLGAAVGGAALDPAA
jgi:hypothetical protein